MYCNKCGTQNPDNSVYCSLCGAKLQSRSEEKPAEKNAKKHKTGLIIALIAGFVVIAAAAALLLLLPGAGRAASAAGSWYNKDLGQTLQFYEDGTVVITTAYGQAKGSYKYDPASGQGVLNVENEDILFTIEGGALVFSGDGGTTLAFERAPGGFEIASVIPTPPPADSGTPVMTPSADTPSAGAEATPVPPAVTTAPPVISPVAEVSSPVITIAPPSATPSASITAPPAVSVGLIDGDFIIDPDLDTVFDVLTGKQDVMGNWYSEYHADTLTFWEDNTYVLYASWDTFFGTYTYDSATQTGTLTDQDGITLTFNLMDDKTTLYYSGWYFYRD